MVTKENSPFKEFQESKLTFTNIFTLLISRLKAHISP